MAIKTIRDIGRTLSERRDLKASHGIIIYLIEKYLESLGLIKDKDFRIEEMFDTVSFSHKTNPFIGDWLLKDGIVPVSVNSWNTFMRMKEHASRMVYFLQGETEKQVDEILDSGVSMVVADNWNDLSLVEGSDALVFLRVKAREHTVYTGKHFVYGFSRDEAEKAASRLGKYGIHFHRKTQNLSEWYLVEDFSDLSDLIAGAEIMNIGGGLPAEYKTSKPDYSSIFKQIRDFREWVNSLGTKLMAEPGRHIAAPAVRLEAFVKNVYGRTAVLDCSIFNAYMDTFLYHLKLLVEGEKEEGHEYLLKGCTPDSLDIFRYSVKFPRKLKRGDRIVFLNAGAYNFHTEFNELERIPHVWVD